MRFKAVSADDEVLGRLMISNLLEEVDGFDLVAECRSGKEVLGAIEKYAPDVVFLDVQMPEVDGLNVIRSLDFDRRPLIVLVTAFDQYAVDAFGLRVFDYLVKPVRESRFAETIKHLRAALTNRVSADLSRASSFSPPQEAGKDYLTVRSGDQLVYLKPEEISAFEAENQYVRLRTPEASYLISTESLNSLQNWLDPRQFVRVHRATILNLEHITGITRLAAGRRAVETDTGDRYPVSRRNMDKMERIIEVLSKQRQSTSRLRNDISSTKRSKHR